MNRDNLKHFEILFLELKKNIMNEMKFEDETLAFEKGDEIDLEENERSRALTLKLLGRQNFMLKKIDLALLKIKEGTYGICDECEGEIELNRLKARPVATQCIACKEAQERGEGNILYEKKSHTLGRAMFSNVINLKQYRENDNIVTLNSENL